MVLKFVTPSDNKVTKTKAETKRSWKILSSGDAPIARVRCDSC